MQGVAIIVLYIAAQSNIMSCAMVYNNTQNKLEANNKDMCVRYLNVSFFHSF